MNGLVYYCHHCKKYYPKKLFHNFVSNIMTLFDIDPANEISAKVIFGRCPVCGKPIEIKVIK